MIKPVAAGVNPLFSVIIPTFNRRELLASALQSVRAQAFQDFEVIVVDDGSSEDIAEAVKANYPEATTYRQEKRGPAAARNFGARHARGKYLSFLDSDDVWFPWTLQIYARVVTDFSKPALILGAPENFSDAAHLLSVSEGSLRTLAFADYFASHAEWRCWGTGFTVVRRDVFDEAGGFVEALINGEDADLVMRVGTAPTFVQVLSPVTFAYRRHAHAMTADLNQTVRGAWHLLATEATGRYPGGAARAQARRRILARHFRSVMVDCVRRGSSREAWRLYKATFRWHVQLRRWSFLLGFPLIAFRGQRV